MILNVLCQLSQKFNAYLYSILKNTAMKILSFSIASLIFKFMISDFMFFQSIIRFFILFLSNEIFKV
jgi:hypothetical protein